MTHPSPEAVPINRPWWPHLKHLICTGQYELQELLDYNKFADVPEHPMNNEYKQGIAISEPVAVVGDNAKYEASLIVKAQVALMDRLWANRVIM